MYQFNYTTMETRTPQQHDRFLTCRCPAMLMMLMLCVDVYICSQMTERGNQTLRLKMNTSQFPLPIINPCMKTCLVNPHIWPVAVTCSHVQRSRVRPGHLWL